MGGLCAVPSGDAGVNRAVGSNLAADKQDDRLTKKLLLLGTGNSGKSTIFKQLKQIHGLPFLERDIIDGLTTIYDSVLGQIKTIIIKCRDLSDSDKRCEFTQELEEAAHYIETLPREAQINEEVAHRIHVLWNSDQIRYTYENRTTLGIVDSCPHFFDDIKRIGEENYRPTDEDLLLVRSATTGVTEAAFRVSKNKFKVIDVGGQRNERRKWIHCFADVTAILYVASLNCYNQTLYEDENINAMEDSLNLFDEIINSRWFRRTAIILFLNKQDLFRIKIEEVPLTVCFPEYVYDPGAKELSKFDHGSDYIRKKFHERNNSVRHQQIYTHITCGIDRDNVDRVFNDVQHIVINASLARGGLL